MNNPFDIKGRDIWVFGGAGHLGQPLIKLLASAGAKVLCADLENRAQAFVEGQGIGGAVTPATIDLKDSKAATEFVARQMAERGVPYGLVNLTFHSTGKRLEELTPEEFDETAHGGLTTTFLLAREIGLKMAAERRGSIVLFSSMYGTVSPDPRIYQAPMNPNPVEYGTTKAGIQQLTRYLAVHWGRANVRVNCISPGPFPNYKVQADHAAFVERLESKSPMGRIGKPEEIAGVVQFLLSDASSYVTGHNLAVDGGWTAW